MACLVLITETDGGTRRHTCAPVPRLRPGTYKVVPRRPPDAPQPTPLDLPRVLFGLLAASAQQTEAALPVPQRVVRDCQDDAEDVMSG